MKQATASRLRDVLGQTYGFRDLTVHPSGETKESVLHPDLGVGVEWRFFSFGFTNVKEVVAGCLSMTAQLLQNPKSTHRRLKQYCEGPRSRIEPVVVQWEARYGPLFRRKEGNAPSQETHRE